MHTVRLAIVAAMLVAAPACGGGDDDSAGGETPGGETEVAATLTHDVFAARANEVCTANDDRVVKIAEDFAKTEPKSGFEPTAAEIGKFVAATIPEFRRMFDELDALNPPVADRVAFGDLVDQGREALARIDKLKDDPKVLLTREFGDSFATFNRGAAQLGLTACAEEEAGGGGH